MVSSDLLSKRPTERGPKIVFRTMAQMATRKASSDRNEVSFSPSWIISNPISPLATIAIPKSDAGAQLLEKALCALSWDRADTKSQSGIERPTIAYSDCSVSWVTLGEKRKCSVLFSYLSNHH